MKPGASRDPRKFRTVAERMEARVVLSGHYSVPAEVQAILKSSAGGPPVRPNTPVLPVESPYATATFVDPTVEVVQGKRTAIGQKDFIAPDVTLNATGGFIEVRSTSTIQDNATLIAAAGRPASLGGIFVGDNVVVGTGARIIGPAAIGGSSGKAAASAAATTSIGPGAIIDGSIIQAGAYVGALARVGPGVILPTGYRVLPGADVTTEAEASDPSLGLVVQVDPADASAATARATIAANSALAAGYSMLYQGQGAAGGVGSAGPVPSAVSATGSTIFFGELNTVLGASSEPGSARVPFEAASGMPSFLGPGGAATPIAINHAYLFPARVVGPVTFRETAEGVAASLGKNVSIRADEGQPITFGGPIGHLGDDVSIHSPLGQVQDQVTSTVKVAITPATGPPTSTTVVTRTTTAGPGTATAGTSAVTTQGINASGVAISTTTTTTVAVQALDVGAIAIGSNFTALDGATILGGPAGPMAIGDDVVIGRGAVVATSVIGTGSTIGSHAYIAGSTIPAGSIVPDGAIIINNAIMGTVPS